MEILGGYVCVDCGEEFYNDTYNPYADCPYIIDENVIKLSAELHCVRMGHKGLKVITGGEIMRIIEIKMLGDVKWEYKSEKW